MKTVCAYCWKSGLIEFGRQCPEGALPLVRGNACDVLRAVGVLATHGYDKKSLFVPKSLAWCEGDMNAAVRDVVRFARGLEDRMEGKS